MFALSTAQQVVWLHEQRQPGGSAYHFTSVLDLTGPLDEAALTRALGVVLRRHAMFRTALVPGVHPPMQQTMADVPLPLVVTELPELEGPPWEALLREHAQRPFDLTAAPLVRWTLVRGGTGRHRLLHTEHHLVHDGRSWTIVLHDLFTAYRDPGSLPAAAPDYAQFIDWENSPTGVAVRESATARWPGLLADARFGDTVPGTRRAGRKSFAGAQHRLVIDPVLAGQVREEARRRRHTPFSVLFAMFAALTSRYTGEPEAVIGTAMGYRPAAFADTVGMFVNAVPVRLRGDPAAPAAAFTSEVMESLLSALDGAAAPIQDITRAVGMSSAGLDNPLFRLMFSAHDAVLPDLDLHGLRVDVTGGVNLSGSRLDIDVVVMPDDRGRIGVPRDAPAGMLLLWDYDTDLYDPEFIALLAARYKRLLAAYVTAPDLPLGELTFAAAAAEPLPAAIGAVPMPAVPGEDLFARLATVAAQRGGADALIAGSRKLSYRELTDQTCLLADRLAAAGVTPGATVAAVLPRSADAVLTLLACLRLGAVFCPLPPGDPRARRGELLRRLRPAAIVLPSDQAEPVKAGDQDPARDCADIAYIMHTSGSTGLPKPVAVSRASLVSHAAAVTRVFHLTADDRVLQFAQPWFDVFLEETLPTLLAGGTLVVAASELPAGAELAALIGLRAVTVANLPTGYAAAVMTEFASALAGWPRSLRLLVLGGERVSAELARQIRGHLGEVDLINAYGVTEATVTSSCFLWPAGDPGPRLGERDDLPIGRPLPGTSLYVVDRDRRPLPAGIVGQIAIGGAGVAIGYLGDPATTARTFGPIPGITERCYLTGDLGYWRADGQLCFTGRRDNQVKILGHRIELEEVESAAAIVLGGARRAVVFDDTAAAPRLVGFVEAGTVPDSEQITAALATRLPRAMLPARWIAVPRIPLLAGDKPDRAALVALIPAAIEPDRAVPGAYEQVRAVWAEVLGIEKLDSDSDFFALGGHSLQAIQIVTRLRESVGDGLPLALLFDEPALGRFAAAVEKLSFARSGPGEKPAS